MWAPIFAIIFSQCITLQAEAFSYDVWEHIPHQCLRDLLLGKDLKEDCQNAISSFISKEKRTLPASFNKEEHTPFNLYCKCGLCDLKFYLRSTLHNESHFIRQYSQSELWRKELILDGSISHNEQLDLQEMISRVFHSGTKPRQSVTTNPLQYWEAFLLLSKQEYWVARLGFLEKDDPHLQHIHPHDHDTIILAIRFIRLKVIASKNFSIFWSQILSGSMTQLTPEEIYFHTVFKQTAENHDSRQNDTAKQLKTLRIKELLNIASEGSKKPRIYETLQFLNSEEFKKNRQQLTELSKNLNTAFNIQKFCYSWVKIIHNISMILVQKHDADTITPLSILLMLSIDSPRLLATLSTLEKIKKTPFYDGWDYYLTLLYCSSEAATEDFVEIQKRLKKQELSER